MGYRACGMGFGYGGFYVLEYFLFNEKQPDFKRPIGPHSSVPMGFPVGVGRSFGMEPLGLFQKNQNERYFYQVFQPDFFWPLFC